MFARLEAVLINKPEKPDNISICLTHSPSPPLFDASLQQTEIKYALCKLHKKKRKTHCASFSEILRMRIMKISQKICPILLFFNLQSYQLT